MEIKVVVICGSESDFSWAEQIISPLKKQNISTELHAASAHKEPQKVLKILNENLGKKVIYITIAGRSNALSGFVGANTEQPTIACPPLKDKLDFMININSTLQMPSKTPVLTILDPANCALAVQEIIALSS
jgi:5-(carboxyamino)imidazole ribonucleotide mutase